MSSLYLTQDLKILTEKGQRHELELMINLEMFKHQIITQEETKKLYVQSSKSRDVPSIPLPVGVRFVAQ